MIPRSSSGLTLVELIVCLAIVGILAAFALPAFVGTTGGVSPSLQALHNMKQLHLATQQMALDYSAEAKANLAWPGTNGTFTNWATRLVPEY